MKKLFILSMAVVMVSCATARLEDDPKHVPKFAPAGYKPTGTVSYLNSGMSWVIKSRRENAFEKMHEACGGAYEILREGSSAPTVAAINPNGFGGYNVVTGGNRWFIEFQCANKAASN
jgi:hypothetical protein